MSVAGGGLSESAPSGECSLCHLSVLLFEGNGGGDLVVGLHAVVSSVWRGGGGSEYGRLGKGDCFETSSNGDESDSGLACDVAETIGGSGNTVDLGSGAIVLARGICGIGGLEVGGSGISNSCSPLTLIIASPRSPINPLHVRRAGCTSI